MNGRASSSGGFTLLEMIVVLAIAALIIGVGAGASGMLTEEHELRKVARDAEIVFMKTATRVLVTNTPQTVSLDSLTYGRKLTVRRAGGKDFLPATGQRLLLRPGCLCEPFTLRWQQEDARWISATLDPLTAAFTDVEDNL